MNEPEKSHLPAESPDDRRGAALDETSEQSSYLQSTDDATWALLSEKLEAFCERWEADGYGPLLQDHLPPADHPACRAILIELIKVDMENRYANEAAILALEDYLAEHSLLGLPDGMPPELIYEEYHLKEVAGLTTDINDCVERFPDKADELLRLFNVEDPNQTVLNGTSFSESFEIGDHIDDFYLMSPLGSGAFGSVFLARQVSMQRLVALKISSDRGTEGQTLAQLDHPNIVRVYDQVRLPDQRLRLLYMQFAAGGTLQAVIRKSRMVDRKTGRIISDCVTDALNHTGVLPSDSVSLTSGLRKESWPEVVCHIGRELALALDYAHQQRILHRDVKPANVLLAANGTPKLADFNISFSSELEGQNAVAYFGGSLSYMSPEQLRAFHPGDATKPEDLDARSDVYSLGVLLWELLFGVRPFEDEAVTSDDLKSTLDGMLKLREQHDGASPWIDQDPVGIRLVAILHRCLQPDPEHRFATAAELATELGWCQHPRVASILTRKDKGWSRLTLQKPLTAFLLAALAPHVIAAVFNFFYNDTWVQDRLSKEAFSAFQKMAIGVNGVAFPVGFLLCIWFSRRVIHAVRNQSVDPICREANGPDGDLNRDCLRLPGTITLIGITEWMIAGLVYPVGLHFIAGPLLLKWHLHFFSSLLICGLIAAAYPFFLTASLCVRRFLPTIVSRQKLVRTDLQLLARLSDRSVVSLYLAGGVPAAGMLVLLLTQDTDNQLSQSALQILSLLGAVGFAWLLTAARSLQADIDAIRSVANRMIERSDGE